MEVLYRNQPVFGAQPAAMVYPSATYSNLSSRMFASPSEAYTCYSFNASPLAGSPHTPSRSPHPRVPGPAPGQPGQRDESGHDAEVGVAGRGAGGLPPPGHHAAVRAERRGAGGLLPLPVVARRSRGPPPRAQSAAQETVAVRGGGDVVLAVHAEWRPHHRALSAARGRADGAHGSLLQAAVVSVIGRLLPSLLPPHLPPLTRRGPPGSGGRVLAAQEPSCRWARPRIPPPPPTPPPPPPPPVTEAATPPVQTRAFPPVTCVAPPVLRSPKRTCTRCQPGCRTGC